jgi:hypothetical protein
MPLALNMLIKPCLDPESTHAAPQPVQWHEALHCGCSSRSLHTCKPPHIVSDILIWHLQGYTAQQRGPDVHMSDARPVQADRRMDRRGRGSRDRADVRRQRFDDRVAAPIDNGRYAQVPAFTMLPIHHGMKSVT